MPQSSSHGAPGRVDIHPLGDRAVVVELDSPISEEAVDFIRRVDERLSSANLPGVRECVPAFCSLTVHYDPAAAVGAGAERDALAFDILRAAIEVVIADIGPAAREPRAAVEIPVCYGGDYGEDLVALALGRGLSADEFIAIHSAATYFVGMIGFLPGFPYLGGLDERLVTPRRATPRSEVPAGSVAIGGNQTGVYPFASPGGWHLIGRTPTRLFDLRRDPPCLLRVGDRVRFVPIARETFAELADRNM